MRPKILLSLFDRNLASPTLETVIDQYKQLRITTKLHGGFGTCNFVIPANIGILWQWHRRRMYYRLLVKDTADKVLFEGRLEDINWTLKQEMKLTFFGYWSSCGDQPYSTGFNTTADAIIKAILTANCPGINSDQSHIDAPDIVIVNVEEDEDLTLIELVPKLAEYSDTSFNTWYFAIWEDRIPYFFARSISSVDWYVTLEQLEALDLRLSARNLYNAAYAEYTVAGAQARTTTYSDATSIAKYGLTRTKAIVGLGAVAQATAETKRAWWVEEDKEIFPETNRIIVSGDVEDKNGGRASIAWMRAGDVLRIRDLLPSSADVDSITRNAMNTFYIRETDYDADRNRIIIVPDNPSTKLEALIYRGLQQADKRAISAV